MISQVEYIWLDGSTPTQQLRSKTKTLEIEKINDILDFPNWSYDGSSTYQSSGEHSDLILKPVHYCSDPLRGTGNYLVMCEVLNSDGSNHYTNKRHILNKLLEKFHQEYEPWFGFEQEYTLFLNGRPLGWPETDFPPPQGPYYCGVGANKVYGRDIIEEHTKSCIDANLCIFGTNAEVMPGQWEFQIGYRGFKNEEYDALTYCDQLYIARWLLCRIAENYNVTVSFDNKPIKGDWNGAGCHTNFSTKLMREKNGLQEITKAIAKLESKHKDHIELYGYGLNERLTGQHETCSIDEFKAGISNRAASVRIPAHVAEKGSGYLEDRRPGANCCPYLVAARLIATICDADEKWFQTLISDQTSSKKKGSKAA